MIQRIQTLYLLVVTALMACTLFLPIAHFVTETGTSHTLYAFSFEGVVGSTWVLGLVLALATALPFVTIFLFKLRKIQVGLCAAEVVLLLGALAFIGIYYWAIMPEVFASVGIATKSFGWAAILPLLAIIPTLLAARAIFKDEILVRSLDRIR